MRGQACIDARGDCRRVRRARPLPPGCRPAFRLSTVTTRPTIKQLLTWCDIISPAQRSHRRSPVIHFAATMKAGHFIYREKNLRRIPGNSDLCTPFMPEASPADSAVEVTTILAVCNAPSLVDACQQPVGRQAADIAIGHGCETLIARHLGSSGFIVRTPGMPMAPRRISRNPGAAP